MAGMASDTGRDRAIGRGAYSRRGRRAPCAWTRLADGSAAGQAMARGGMGGGDQRNV
jgi:hypothetical protein